MSHLLRGNRPLAAALLIGAGLTVFVTLLPVVEFAYEKASLHLALDPRRSG